MIFIATIGGLVTLLFWGVGDYLTGKSGQKGDVYLTNLFVQCIGLFLFTVAVIGFGFSIPNWNTVFLVAIVGFIFNAAFITFIKALAIGPFGIASPISSSYALITLVISILFFGYQTSSQGLLALFLIILGVVVLSVDRDTFNLKKFHGSVVYFSVITALMWGVGFALADQVLQEITWYEFLFLLNVFTTLYSALYFYFVHKRLPSLKQLSYATAHHAWKAGVFLSVGSAAFFMVTEYSGSIVIPAVISAAAPLVTSFLAHVHDNERLSKYKRSGAIIVVLGLILLNVL